MSAPCRVVVPLLLALAGGVTAADVATPLDDAALLDESGWVEAVSRRRQRVETAPQPVTVLTAADLVNTPATTIPDRLRYVPGVDVYQSRHGQYDVGLNGWNALNNNRIQVQVDGEELRQEEFGAVTWIGAVHQSAVRSLEIIKGPSSVAYGANAFGGVIAIQERQADHQHRLWLNSAIGDYGRYEADGTGMGPLGTWGYYRFSVGGTALDDLPGTVSPVPVVPSARTGGTSTADMATGHWTSTLGVLLPRDHRLEGTWKGQRQSTWELVDDYDLGSNDTTTDWNDLVLRLRGPVLDARYRRRWSDRVYEGQKSIYDPTRDWRYIQAGFDSMEDVARAQINLSSAGNTVSFGGEYRVWRSTSNLWGDGDYLNDASWTRVDITNRAVFAEDQWTPASWLALTAGLRYDDHSVVDANWSPRLAVNLIPDRTQYVLLSYSSGYRNPAPLETQIRELYFAADPDIRAEKVHALELAWRKRWSDLDASTGLGSFLSRANGLILPMPLSPAAMQANWYRWLGSGPDVTRQPGPFLAYTNVDNPALLGGIDGEGKIRLGDSPAVLWTNATWQEFHFTDPIVYASPGFIDPVSGGTLFRFARVLPRDINGPPRFKASLGCNTDRGPLLAGVVGRYVSAREAFSIGNSDLSQIGYVGVQTIPEYTALDATLGWRFWSGDGLIRVAVMDLLDQGGEQVYSTTTLVLTRDLEQAAPSTIGRTWTIQGQIGF
jgi:outer membrane receptor protein involved in Fe transport